MPVDESRLFLNRGADRERMSQEHTSRSRVRANPVLTKRSPGAANTTREPLTPSWPTTSLVTAPERTSCRRMDLSAEVVTSTEPSYDQLSPCTAPLAPSSVSLSALCSTSQILAMLSLPPVATTFSAVGCHLSTCTARLCPAREASGVEMSLNRPPSGIWKTRAKASSEAVAMTEGLNGENCRSKICLPCAWMKLSLVLRLPTFSWSNTTTLPPFEVISATPMYLIEMKEREREKIRLLIMKKVHEERRKDRRR